MKTLQVLDQRGSVLVSDALNQRILRELIESEYSVTELARKLNIPTLKLWRRMQKLISAHMVELSTIEKTANIEKKLYRSAATTFVPQSFWEFRPKDPKLLEAFKIYTDIQKAQMAVLSKFYEIPKDAEPLDYALYVSMLTVAQVYGEQEMQEKIAELKNRLSEYGSSPSIRREVVKEVAQ